MMINSVAQTVGNIHGGDAATDLDPRQSSVINAIIAALEAKNEAIAAIGRELAAKDSIIAVLQKQLANLQSQVDDLRARISSTDIEHPFPIGTAEDLNDSQ